MLYHLSGAAGALYRRAADETPAYQLPNWALLVLMANVLVFFPILLFIGYTLNHVYPVLAMVEDENPPAYEPLSLQDPGPEEEEADDPTVRKPPSGITGRDEPGAPRAVTSSLRATNRLIRSTGGWRANFRGLACLFVQAIASTFLSGIFMFAFPRFLSPLGHLLASIALLPLSTAWVHIVISTPQPRSFRHRMPPFRRAFDAAAKPAAVAWLAREVSVWSVYLLSAMLGLELPKDHGGNAGSGTGSGGVRLPRPSANTSGRAVLVILVALALQVLLVIPTQVVLVRVQASLLPPEEDTIVPFDRLFGGRVEPALVGGKGYASMRDAWATFSRGAWKRLVVLYVKIFFATMALFGLMAAVIVPEVLLMAVASG